MPGNWTDVQVVEARDRGFQVHVTVAMEQSRPGLWSLGDGDGVGVG